MCKQKRNLRSIQVQVKSITLLGIAHVSQSSLDEVEQQLLKNQFGAVAVDFA